MGASFGNRELILLSEDSLTSLVLVGLVIVLIAVLLGRRQSARAMIDRRDDTVVDGHEPGSWQDYFTNIPEAVPLTGVFSFSYEDVEGSYTTRTVEALMLIPRQDSVTLFGRCRETNEYRHFNLARARKMVDAESGERIESPELDLVRRCRASK